MIIFPPLINDTKFSGDNWIKNILNLLNQGKLICFCSGVKEMVDNNALAFCFKEMQMLFDAVKNKNKTIRTNIGPPSTLRN